MIIDSLNYHTITNMEKKLAWLNNFIDSEFYAPYKIKEDCDYYKDLRKKYKYLLIKAKASGADDHTINIINNYSDRICEAILCYYKGNITTTHKKIKNLIKDCCSNMLAVNTLNDSCAFPGYGKEIQFFRARLSDKAQSYEAKDMLHLPFDKRSKTGNFRFSIPGVPSLYLGNSSYACWVEMGNPPEYQFNVSPVILDGSQRIFNLAVRSSDILKLDEFEEDHIHCWLKLFMLMIATSYVVEEKGRNFNSEYIISQSIMLACKDLGIDGVAYYSKRVSDEAFSLSAVNLALFANYSVGDKYSDLCRHLKIDDSFNYSMFKQLGGCDRNSSIELRLSHVSSIFNIGSYKKQFDYRFTEFFTFDKFLYSNWKEKDEMEWGNVFCDL